MRCAIPVNGLPGSGVGAAREHGDVMAALLKIAREHLAHLAAAAGHNYTQPARLGGWNDLHSISL